jgi:hypothetical protein
MKNLTLLLLIVIALISCEKEIITKEVTTTIHDTLLVDTCDYDTVVGDTSGSNYIILYIDGQKVELTNSGIDMTSYIGSEDDYNLSIYGDVDGGGFVFGTNESIFSLDPKTYPIPSGNNYLQYGSLQVKYVINSIGYINFSCENSDLGELIITKIDTVNNLFSATFEKTICSEGLDPIEITGVIEDFPCTIKTIL